MVPFFARYLLAKAEIMTSDLEEGQKKFYGCLLSLEKLKLVFEWEGASKTTHHSRALVLLISPFFSGLGSAGCAPCAARRSPILSGYRQRSLSYWRGGMCVNHGYGYFVLRYGTTPSLQSWNPSLPSISSHFWNPPCRIVFFLCTRLRLFSSFQFKTCYAWEIWSHLRIFCTLKVVRTKDSSAQNGQCFWEHLLP